MNQTQEEQLRKFLAIREFFAQYPLFIESRPDIKIHYETFLSNLNFILKSKEMMDENNSLLSNYNAVKENLIRVIISISRKITAYSLLEELTDIQGLFCFSYEELSQESDEKLIEKSRNLNQYVFHYKQELLDYGIDDLIENKLCDLTEQFQLLLGTKILQTQTSLATDHVTQILNETTHNFESNLQSLNNLYLLKTTS
jgi:hypothetical protein